ncbi:MAG TPA: hypothetical protein PK036_07745 [Geobacteraceae bacterium]|nr:hypothetical protein [Geobacteraceae bacterium]
MNVGDYGSRRLRRVSLDGPIQPARMEETGAFREDEGVKAPRIQVAFIAGSQPLSPSGRAVAGPWVSPTFFFMKKTLDPSIGSRFSLVSVMAVTHIYI